ncbi:hypothetical protein IRP63_11320 [Clostridium botulinum]|uniref:Uncharacterized protein n=1 Tax=Clostridium botulinum C/D str. DC5 TaxID=1443128 RepID=A0A0A0IG44_CLOBO|nr:hypothetical protein [Clostridium botulinum]KEI06954.1 hypothetical protein Z952_02745 [Clostridium botulinum C/D str. BKT75002]KEI08250.1 hypothetical protein Z954_01910 [Clostridium botulinum C/D str. BKT2873]KGM95712.1 hypothetical protein Z956_04000 [Clostridium botulinum D str. CCUG 7971]KGN00445.1 hypothetical protein Z955_03655 [Clostridium botulinum C/D str. DC5]KOC48040.1 hypothetical protein ADU88_08855 [Clostridium botulinum]
MYKYINSNQQPKEGYIDILNLGGFLIYFWGSYDYFGSTRMYISRILAVGEEQKITIPPDATNINLNVEFLFFPGIWIPLFSKNFEKNDERCYVTYGVTFIPLYAEVPCTSPGIISQVFSSGVFLPYSVCPNKYS